MATNNTLPTQSPAAPAPTENSSVSHQMFSPAQGHEMTTPSGQSQIAGRSSSATTTTPSARPTIMRSATGANAPLLTSAATVRQMPTVPPPSATPPARSATAALNSTPAAPGAIPVMKRKPSASTPATTTGTTPAASGTPADVKRPRPDGTPSTGVVAAGAPASGSGLSTYLAPLSVERTSLLAGESALFMQLLALERRVDQALVRKQLEMAEANRTRSTSRPGSRVLRLLLSCTLSNQTATYHVDETSLQMSLAEPPHWTFRLEGVLVDPLSGSPAPQPRRRFSSLVRRVVIELTHRPAGAAPRTELVEWDRSGLPLAVPNDGVDGLEVSRRSAGDVKARLLLWPEHSPPRFRLAAPLAALLGLHTESKPRVITALWQYIKLHKLQDPEDRKMIRLNAELRSLFGGADVLPFASLPDLLGPLLAPPDPIEINYEMHMAGSREGTAARDTNEEAYDVPVEIEESSNTLQLMRADCDKLDVHLTQCAAALEEHRPRRDFLRSFASHPRDCLHALVNAHAHDLAMRAGPPAGPDFERTAFHFLQPLAPIAAQHYLYSQPSGGQH